MKIEYTNGTGRITANDRKTIENIIREDIGPDAVYYGGYVWTNESESENDDGGRAVAKLWNDEGIEFAEELDSL